MSTTTDSDGRARSSCHRQLRFSPVSEVTVNTHLSLGISGVVLADNTGKSSVRCWPGGSLGSSERPFPSNPRLTTAIWASLRARSVILPARRHCLCDLLLRQIPGVDQRG